MTLRLASAAVVALTLSIGCSDDNESISTGPTSTSHGSSVSSASGQGGCRLPPAPTNLRVASINRTTVELVWSPVAGATSYTMMVGRTPGGSDVLFGNTSQPSFRFTAPDGRSYARVEASTGCGAGPATGSISFVVPG